MKMCRLLGSGEQVTSVWETLRIMRSEIDACHDCVDSPLRAVGCVCQVLPRKLLVSLQRLTCCKEERMKCVSGE